MRIGFDVSQTGPKRAGCGYFADSLIRQLSLMNREVDYILYPFFGNRFCSPDAVHTTSDPERPNVKRWLTGKNCQESFAFWNGITAHGEKDLGSPDIIHSNNYYCPRGLTRARVVYTLHDLSFVELPHLTTEHNRSICFEGVFNAAIDADLIITPSAHTRNVFRRIFPHYPRQIIEVVHEASRFMSRETARGKTPKRKLTPSEFWLSVGTLEPRKNFRRLIVAYARFRREGGAGYPLVLVGGEGWLEDDFEAFIEDSNISKDVIWLGYLPDDELCWLYQNCLCFIYPSLYEGFGLPVLEAMGFGAAVITSNVTSLPEVAGDAAHYVDPRNEEDICGAMRQLFEDREYRSSLMERALLRAGNYSWSRCAAEVMEIYKKVLAMDKYSGPAF
jgi:glycosyltransferase involved in cell wall biosynthesis